MSNLTVHTIVGAWGIPSVSPFCMKLETWLQMVELPYERVVDATPFAGPKGKLPWVEYEGHKIGDSSLIIEHLTERTGRDADAGLSGEQRAAGRALRCLLEENLYWALVYDRWFVDANWHIVRDIVLGGVPAPVRPLVAAFARRGVRAQLKGHGIGLHTRDEIHAIGCKDMAAVSDFLGTKPYLMGEQPTGIDASAYGTLANVLKAPVVSPIRDEGLKRENLVAYLDRMQERFFA